MKARVELWDTSESCVEAVRQTLGQLPGGNSLLIEEGGNWYVVGSEFSVWAAEHQGYVKRVLSREDGR